MVELSRSARALLSVSDKRGIADIARRLAQLGYELVASGGTAEHLQSAGLAVVSVESLTGMPPLLDGRVKTLHPHVHAPILARRESAEDMASLAERGLLPVDVVMVDLYGFETAWSEGLSAQMLVEKVDIGGVALVRAAAKNFASVVVAATVEDREALVEALEQGRCDEAVRREFARRAFVRTAAYDRAIARWLEDPGTPFAQEQDCFAQAVELTLERVQALRYGENPHQKAALYRARGPGALGAATSPVVQHHGRELSYNNIVDMDAALNLVAMFDAPAAAVIKHTNPAGVAVAPDVEEAFQRAFAADSLSAFGGVVALNRTVDAALARRLAEPFLEVVAAPGFSPEALEILERKKNLRLVSVDPALPGPSAVLRVTRLGVLLQGADVPSLPDAPAWKTVTRQEVPPALRNDLAFAWAVAASATSNAIAVARDAITLGVGAGQMSRVDAVRLALAKAKDSARGAVLASDGFFPFADSVELAAQAGIAAIVQPGGSVRDAEVIAACDALGIPMVLTGRRHFRH